MKKCDYLSFILWGSVFAAFFSRAVKILPSGLYFGHETLWGDWALHLSMAQIFAKNPPETWLSFHPSFADGKLIYPFMANLISGLLMRLGFSIPSAFEIPSIITAFGLVWVSQLFLTKLLGSSKKAFLALTLFFLSAGFGFIKFLTEFVHAPSLQMFLYPPARYSDLTDFQWYSGNVFVGMLLPQRAFLLGMAVCVAVFLGLLKQLDSPTKNQKRIFLILGVVAGFLPIIHAHSFLCLLVFIPILFWFFKAERKPLLHFLLPFFGVSFVVYGVFLGQNVHTQSFLKLNFGFSASSFSEWIHFWLYVWGPILPIALGWGIYRWRAMGIAQRVFWSWALALFLLANIIQFQPLLWDNSKLFLWSYFILCAFCADFLIWLWEKRLLALRGTALILIACSTFTGILELIRFEQVDRNTFQSLDHDEIVIGEMIEKKTVPSDRFLTAPVHNHPVSLIGARSILMGYPAWAMNYGFDTAPVEADIREIYKGSPNASSLLKKRNIQFVFIGPKEHGAGSVNEQYFKDHYPLLLEKNANRVYDVRLELNTPQ